MYNVLVKSYSLSTVTVPSQWTTPVHMPGMLELCALVGPLSTKYNGMRHHTVPFAGNCSYGEVRLVGGGNEYEGRVELCSSGGLWGTVCDDHFDVTEADIVCRQLKIDSERK